MARIVFPLSTSPGEKFVEGAGRLINCFAEPRGAGADVPYVIKRSPGAQAFAATGFSTYRGGILLGSNFFVAFDNQVVRLDSNGTVTSVAALSGTDKVFWARNNNVSPQLVVVCEDGPFEVTTGAVTTYSDADVGSPNAVCFLDGFFFFTYGNGTCIASDINDVTIDPANVATAEFKPDGLLRPIPWNGQLWLFGTQSIEVWAGNPTNATGFPFNRVTTISRGLLSAHAVAGHEDGFGDALIFVGDDDRVYILNGYQPVAISPPDLDRRIEECARNGDELEATVYKAGGHAFWELSCSNWTWVFNVNNQKWHERASYLQKRSRLTQAQFAFSKWLCGDTLSDSVLEITDETAQEKAGPFVARAESLATEKFPNRIRVPRADFEFATGVGIAVGTDPIQTDPSVRIAWSDDGGLNWSNPLIRKLGRQARTEQRVTVLNTGLSGPNGRKWRVDLSDPVHLGLMGGEQSVGLGAK